MGGGPGKERRPGPPLRWEWGRGVDSGTKERVGDHVSCPGSARRLTSGQSVDGKDWDRE